MPFICKRVKYAVITSEVPIMLHTGTLLRAEIYDDHTKPYTNVKDVYEAHKNKHPGKLIVTNAHWYTISPKLEPCGNYKVNGTVLDGSGSSQCYDGATYQRGDGRTIYSYPLWFANEGGTGRDDTD